MYLLPSANNFSYYAVVPQIFMHMLTIKHMGSSFQVIWNIRICGK